MKRKKVRINGTQFASIAKACANFGTNYAAMKTYARELGTTVPNALKAFVENGCSTWTPQQVFICERMLAEHAPIEEISKMTGKSVRQIHRFAKRNSPDRQEVVNYIKMVCADPKVQTKKDLLGLIPSVYLPVVSMQTIEYYWLKSGKADVSLIKNANKCIEMMRAGKNAAEISKALKVKKSSAKEYMSKFRAYI